MFTHKLTKLHSVNIVYGNKCFYNFIPILHGCKVIHSGNQSAQND